MRVFSVVFTVLVLVSCVVPVEVPQGAAPTCSVPDDLGFFMAGQPKTLTFPGCAAASFTADPGVALSAVRNDDGSKAVTITPSSLGVPRLRIESDGMVWTRPLPTDETITLDAGFVRRYADTLIPPCAVSQAGRLVCSSPTSDELFVYGLDGGLESRLAGELRPGSLNGAELWTFVRASQQVEHRTETPAGFVLDGTLVVPSRTNCFPCAVEPGRIVTFQDTNIVDVIADGGSLAFGSLNLPGMVLPPVGQLILDGPAVWGENLCRYERGCTTRTCNAVESCVSFEPAYLNRITRADANHLWVMTAIANRVEIWKAPLSAGQVVARRNLRFDLYNLNPRASREIRAQDSSVFVWKDDFILERSFWTPPLDVTDRWMVFLEAPRDVRFIAR